ncbi:Na/Pi cotransporter family protein [Rhizobium rhizogenes]|uniref:Na/Pi cotransporter family protein n=1 Tax=Rhizobium rhizogenes TaxID=359 RepID=UPI00226D495E|nr:Na/Pi cotransporter family protein [Rhizobium rhizogenes]
MTGSLVILELMGHVALLLWGMRMVQGGIEKAFGSDLRRVLGRALRNRLVAVAAGAGVTMLLQSSTATVMMVTSFAARGAVALIPALAVMLGANVGTALIVKALSFDVSFISPLLLLAGYVAFKRGPKGRMRQLGRVGIGLGLMLLALHGLVQTIQPVSTAPVLRSILDAITGDPVLDVLLAAALTFAAHSSVAVMLLLVGLAAGDVITPTAGIALVLGANLGGALPPVFETNGANPANRRVPVGNLMFRAIGCIVALPFLQPLADLFQRYVADPASVLTDFHLAFNVVLAVVCVGLLGPTQSLLIKLYPEKIKAAGDAARPLFLDKSVLETPYLALASAAREILRMGDLVEALLRLVPADLSRPDKQATSQAVRLGKELDMLHEAVKAYLARLEPSELTDRDAGRLSDVIEFAVNLGHAGDILERCLDQVARRPEGSINAADHAALQTIQTEVASDLRLALSTLTTEDSRSAQELVDAKRHLNEAERTAARDHLLRLGGANPAVLGSSSLFLATLRDLKLVNSHLASIGYAVLGAEDSGASRALQEDTDKASLV